MDIDTCLNHIATTEHRLRCVELHLQDDLQKRTRLEITLSTECERSLAVLSSPHGIVLL